MSTIEFTKMHNASNDYIYVNTIKYPLSNPEELAVKWSAYHTGIGSDGLILIGTSSKADFSMRIFNADGSEAKMCGNGVCCIGKYLYEYRLTNKEEITLETLSGIKILKLNVQNGMVSAVTVNMGSPSDIREVDFAGEYPFTATALSMGNPHLVIFTDDITNIDLSNTGLKLENHPFFPERTNVEFAQVGEEGKIRTRVWERGSGVTQACGTGACATAVTAVIKGKAGRKTDIIMDGGVLTIVWDEPSGHVFLTGKPEKVFDGTITID
ncbi:Diaminopimelate epimerase [termite gut metagenome]|jgi:diaminopimelate epimerase|uniref:Diaminopimelate epimerase n=1 Tax=termite gut metagenome TaxID=433724 RepID=A0A5J4T0J1_9ZZZZ